jgi:hypothetical protein
MANVRARAARARAAAVSRWAAEATATGWQLCTGEGGGGERRQGGGGLGGGIEAGITSGTMSSDGGLGGGFGCAAAAAATVAPQKERISVEMPYSAALMSILLSCGPSKTRPCAIPSWRARRGRRAPRARIDRLERVDRLERADERLGGRVVGPLQVEVCPLDLMDGAVVELSEHGGVQLQALSRHDG